MFREPGPHCRGLVGAVVVADEVHIQLGRYRLVDRGQELSELDGAVLAMQFADHRAVGDVERGEQTGDPVTGVVLGAPFGHAGHHRQDRLGPVEGLDLALLVDTEHDGPLGRVVVQADDVNDLFDEQRVRGQCERLGTVGLEAELPPDPSDRGLRQSRLLGHRCARPVGGVTRGLLQRRDHDVLDPVEADRRRAARALLVHQPVEPQRQEPPPPLTHRGHVDSEIPCDVGIRRTFGAGQDDP